MSEISELIGFSFYYSNYLLNIAFQNTYVTAPTSFCVLGKRSFVFPLLGLVMELQIVMGMAMRTPRSVVTIISQLSWFVTLVLSVPQAVIM